MRDTTNGPELLAQVDVPADCQDVSAFLESLPAIGRKRAPRLDREDSTGDYDNVTRGSIVEDVYQENNEDAMTSDGVTMTTQTRSASEECSERRPLLSNGGSNIPQVRSHSYEVYRTQQRGDVTVYIG
jgi:hypothetical protein